MIRFLLRITGIEKKIINEEIANFESVLQEFRQCFYSTKIPHRKHIYICIDKMYSDFKKGTRPNGLNIRDYVDNEVENSLNNE